MIMKFAKKPEAKITLTTYILIGICSIIVIWAMIISYIDLAQLNGKSEYFPPNGYSIVESEFNDSSSSVEINYSK